MVENEDSEWTNQPIRFVRSHFNVDYVFGKYLFLKVANHFSRVLYLRFPQSCKFHFQFLLLLLILWWNVNHFTPLNTYKGMDMPLFFEEDIQAKDLNVGWID